MSPSSCQPVTIQVGSVALEGDLCLPAEAHGLVIFVHGSGSSRQSPRNKFVAQELQKVGLATLLFDLLTEEEDETYENRFDIATLTKRLVLVVQWTSEQTKLKDLPIGLFGASTGAAAALQAAAELKTQIKAVVSRGGRPDLAGDALGKVKAPTLLIVGGDDDVVIGLNQQAYDQLDVEKKLEIVPGATHLFEEPGTLEQVAVLATAWFSQYLR